MDVPLLHHVQSEAANDLVITAVVVVDVVVSLPASQLVHVVCVEVVVSVMVASGVVVIVKSVVVVMVADSVVVAAPGSVTMLDSVAVLD